MITIQNALIAVGVGEDGAIDYQTATVQIQEDRIVAIQLDSANGNNQNGLESSSESGGEVVDGRDKLLLPGFVNAHTHSSELWQRGLVPPLPLELWIADLYDFTPLDPEQVYLSAIGTAVETLLSGGTSVVDHLVLIPGQERETVAAAVRGYREVGIRAFIGPLIQDQSLPAGIPTKGTEVQVADYLRATQATLELMADVVSAHHRPEEGISVLVAPTGIQLCSDELFQGCIELSNQHNLCRHAHLLETRAQQLLAQEKYGCSAVEHLERIGYLGERTSLAHCVWLSEADLEIMARTRSTVVHNPLSNLRLGSGIAPVLKYRALGVNVSFGCDGAASNDGQDMLEAIKIGSILHNITDPDYHNWITPFEAIQMASAGGAKGLGLADQMGSLSVGQKADLVLYDLNNLSLLPRTDPVGLLVLGRPTNVVHSAWVDGKQIVTAGSVQTSSVERLREELIRYSGYHKDRTVQGRPLVEARYREVMGLPLVHGYS
ncbi:amidohydrolase [Leptolyngbya sp. FACHB-261]|uniref:amidohydrolase n=1 Tax=Leptolyngbya sp. FACHB-261 TaxID=2692806 RepID=UPI0016858BA0|nr:amidohydrolase [Leptolyngbya sp. FACHB-261]MBD2099471.1 amidohydrolase [Leptolyngbya sp. FACHB-261]